MTVMRCLSVALVLVLCGLRLAARECERGPTSDGKSLAHWLVAIKSTDATVRKEAAAALGRLHPVAKAAVPALRTALTDANPDVRLEAACSLVRIDREFGQEVEPFLIAALADPRAKVREQAAESLGEIAASDRAVVALRAALKGPDRHARLAAACALATVRPADAKDTIPTLIDGLVDDRPLREDTLGWNDAEQALMRLGWATPAPVLALRAALKDPARQLLAAGVLGEIGPHAQEAVPALLAARRSKDLKLRLLATGALVEIDSSHAPAAVPILIAALRAADEDVQAHAVFLLSELGPTASAAAPALLRYIRRDWPEGANKGGHRTDYAADALAQIGPRAKEVLPGLIALLDERKGRDADAALFGLGQLGPRARPVVPELLARAKKAECGPSSDALLVALACIEPKQAQALVPTLTEYVQTGEIAADEAVTSVLATFGPSARGAAPGLLTAARTWSPLGRPRAVKALVHIDPARAESLVPDLLTCLKSGATEERLGAIRSLALIGPPARTAIPSLVAVLGTPAPGGRAPTRLNETDLLAALRAPEEIEHLHIARRCEQGMLASAEMVVDMLEQKPTVALRRAAALALGRIGPAARKAIPALLAACGAADPRLRFQAACALAMLDAPNYPEVLPALQSALRDPQWAVRAGAAKALGEMGAAAQQAVPSLVQALDDPVRFVRRAATRALQEIAPDALGQGLR